MNNNLFEFATSELSQDAFICWCVNWFNDDSKPELKRMATVLLRKLSGTEKIEQVKIFRQFSEKVTVKEKGVSKEIKLKIDVLLIVNEKIAVIIEDKTYTGEHDNQIARYAYGLHHLAANSEKYKEFASVGQVRTVYLKTGFMYDNDKLVETDLVITGEEFLDLLSPYEGNSEILDSYIAHLHKLQKWYTVHGCYDDTAAPSFWDWNIAQHQIAQYRLMRTIFPEKDWWTDHSSWDYGVYHGSSFGRPWTEMQLFERTYKDTEDKYSVFWRIDTDKKGPYISLRFYEDFQKGNTTQDERHRKMYENMKTAVCRIVKGHPDLFYFIWDKNVDPGNCGGYKESSLIHLRLQDKLKNWSTEKETVIQSVQELTRLFSEKTEELHI